MSYFLEVDLEYPDKLHELHNGYLSAPEKLEISHNMFVPNLGNKKKISY